MCTDVKLPGATNLDDEMLPITESVDRKNTAKLIKLHPALFEDPGTIISPKTAK